jgi:hypothetical protein
MENHSDNPEIHLYVRQRPANDHPTVASLGVTARLSPIERDREGAIAGLKEAIHHLRDRWEKLLEQALDLLEL